MRPGWCIMDGMDTDRRYDNNCEKIAAYLAAGACSPGDARLGFELEHFIVDGATRLPVTYRGHMRSDGSHVPGIIDVLTALSDNYDSTIMQSEPVGPDALIGLVRDKATITLEPGAQLEVSIGPAKDVAEIERVYTAFRTELDEVLAEAGYEVVLLGSHPSACARDIPILPKERYHLMDAHFAQTGSHGICMMRGTASTQVSIDYLDEADATRKFRIANLIGPLLAFLTDNAPVFEREPVGLVEDLVSAFENRAHGHDDTRDLVPDVLPCTVETEKARSASGIEIPYRMVRTAVWDDVDADRSLVCPATFEDGSLFDAYARLVMDRPPILTMEPDAVGHGFEAARDIYADRDLDTSSIEHLLSMFFFDVRFKQYLEIRVADALPPRLAFAFAALIEGLFYNERNLDVLSSALAGYGNDDVVCAKRNLARDGFHASVYGKPAHVWLDELIALADTDANPDRSYLAPLSELVLARETPLDAYARRSIEQQQRADMPAACGKTGEMRDEFIATMKLLGGDVEGRKAVDDYIEHSTAVYHGQVVAMAFVPQFLDQATLCRFSAIVATVNGILDKMIEAYRQDPSYRALFHFPPELEHLTLLPTGYPCDIPVGRYDVFYDEDTADFTFCELNTDGTSAMNEELEMTRALTLSESFEVMRTVHKLQAQDLYEGWIDEFLRIYESSEQRVNDPFVAIVDFEASATPHEIREFARRFRARGVRADVCYMEHLVWHEALVDESGLPVAPGLYTDDGRRIDAVYRRAVTAEVIDAIRAGRAGARRSNADTCPSTLRMPESDPALLDALDGKLLETFGPAVHSEEHLTGVFALVKAVEESSICMEGGFITNIPHCKQVFQVMHAPETRSILSEEENAFIDAHIPVTNYLTASQVDLDAIKAAPMRWIIKPSDRSSSLGVFAGRDCADDAEWAKLVDAHTDDDYVVQTYCEQYAAPNTHPWPLEPLSSWNLLTGLFSYGEKLGGVYMRAGQRGIIVGYAGGVTVGTFLADCNLAEIPDQRIVLRDLDS